jgi:hypothetical protein
MFVLTRLPEVDGIPILKARFVVPPSDQLTDKAYAKFKIRWHDLYRTHKRFVFVIDLTDPSMSSFALFWMLPKVVEVLKETRPLAEKMLVATVIVTGACGKALIGAVDALYPLLPYKQVYNLDEAERVVTKCIKTEMLGGGRQSTPPQ